MKIAQQKGYPDTEGTVHPLLADAQKSQSTINLNKLADAAGTTVTHKQFIDDNPAVILEYIKYNCQTPKSAAKPKAADKKTAKPKK